jgi:hypothetical protein
MTYLAGGRQCSAVAVGKRGEPAELVALTLPENRLRAAGS